MNCSPREIAAVIDHSLLAPSMTPRQMEDGCRQGRDLHCASVCVMPFFVPRCVELLAGSGVRPSTTIGFPHGGHATAVKAAEAREALRAGAVELDMVTNISKAVGGDWAYVAQDIRAVLHEVRQAAGAKLKVIFENCFLSDGDKIRLCEICGELAVDWVKTSTGFGSGGATDDDLRLMRRYSPPHVQVKAAGGIRTLGRLLEVRALGVTRVGASRTAEILAQCEEAAR
jgi:deoxyribose-phosphate aldolase